MTEFRRHIVLATDLTVRCDRAFDRAVLLASEWDAKLTIVHALGKERSGRGLALHRPDVECARRDAEAQVRSDLEAAGMTAGIVVRPGSAPTLVAALAQRSSCNLIVAGVSGGPGIAQALRGSTFEALARKSATPVLTVGSPAQNPYESAVVGTGFSDGSRAALQATLGLFPEAEVTTLHAYRQAREGMASAQDPDAVYKHVVSAYTRFVTNAAPGRWPTIRRVAEIGYAETLLQEYAEKRRIDLIAVGLEDRHPLLTYLLGGTVQPLVRRPPCDVLIVPAKWRAFPRLTPSGARPGRHGAPTLSPMGGAAITETA